MKIYVSYIFSICQSIGGLPIDIRKSLVFENGRLPKNPLKADNGLGWVDVNIRCLLLVIRDFFWIALLPHKIKTTGSFFSFINCIILSVSCSQPLFLWEFAAPSLTVRTVLRSKTPWSAHFFKYPLLGI